MLAGFAMADITPPLGTPLAGHFRRRLAQGVHDPLHATAVVFDDGAKRAAIVSCDLLCVTRPVTEAARDIIHQQVGIEPQAVLIAATHTHAGPEIRPERGANDGYVELLVEKIATAVVLAARALREVELLVAEGREERISFNRRYRMRDGSVRTNPGAGNPEVVEPAGPIDPQVLTLWAMSSDGPAGVMVNFACHLDVLGAANQLISADVPYYLRRTIAGATGRLVPVVYLNGACGDINHIDIRHGTRGTFAHSEFMGRVLAGEALRSLQEAGQIGDGPVAAASRKVDARRRRFDEQTLRWARQTAADPAVPVDSWDYHRARRVLRAAAAAGETVEAEVSAVRVGQLGIVGLPGEVFCQIGLAIKEASAAGETMVAELANDNLGYVPTEQAFSEGGYEVESAQFDEDLGQRLADAAIELLGELFRA